MKKIGLGGFFLISVLGIEAWALKISPEDLATYVRERNGKREAAYLVSQSAESETGHFARSFLPKINLEAGGERFQTGPYSWHSQPFGAAEVTVNLFRSGKDLLESRAKDAGRDSAQAGLRLTESALLAEARRYYWSLVTFQELVEIYREALQENKKSLASVSRRVARGITTETDRLDLELYESQLQEDLESAEHEMKIISIRLAALLGLPDGEKIEPAATLVHQHDDALLGEEKGESAPLVLSLAALETESISQASVAKRYWAPSLDAYGGYYLYTVREREHLEASNRNDYAIGLKLTLPLWDGGQSHAHATAQAFQAESRRVELAQERKDTASRIRAAQEEMRHAHDLMHQVEERAKQGAVYVSRTISEYDRGVKNGPDMLGALQRQIGFRKRLVELKAEYQSSKTELLQLLGR